MKNRIYGTVHVFTQDKEGNRTTVFESKNQIQDGYATILPLLLAGDPAGKVNTLYLEYKNVADSSEEVAATAFQPSDDAVYYTTLNENRDYVRHHMIITPSPEEGAVTFKALLGNDTGEHGLPFGDTALSKIYGMALVAAKDPNDQTKDIVFARKAWDTQKVKTTDDIYIEWTIHFST